MWCHLLLLATYETYKGLRPGQCRVSLRYLEQDTNSSRPTVIAALGWLEQAGMIERKKGVGSQLSTVTIVNWKRFQSEEAPETSGSGKAPGQIDSPGALPHYKKVQETRRTPSSYKPTSEAIKCVAHWAKYRPLPEGVQEEVYQKIFDDMVRLDGVTWKQVGLIVKHAVEVWEPAYIQSPSKLRQKSRAYPELKTWQVIEQQLGNTKPRSRGDDDLDDLMEVSQ